MKFLISILAAVSLIVIGVPVIKVNAQEPNISNSPPGEYAFGTLDASSSYQTGLYFTVQNNSGYDVKITIRGSDMTGGATWILADDALPGEDTYGLKAGLADESYNVTVRKNIPYNTLIDNLPDGETQSWGLQLLAPTSFTDGVLKSGTVTLTATAI